MADEAPSDEPYPDEVSGDKPNAELVPTGLTEKEGKFSSMRRVGEVSMTATERRKLRRQYQDDASKTASSASMSSHPANDDTFSDGHFTSLLLKNEDELLRFVARVNKVYQEKLKKPAPFMTFVFCGMQSAGKSTVMERFMNAVLNIVQEGTGTRCPLDTTCIHDDKCTEARCDLSGNNLADRYTGEGLSMMQVFESITAHNKSLAEQDKFDTEPLFLVYRSANVQNMRFVDTPGIIATQGQGKDNREDIKTILRSEMSKPNTKLCVLLEPKEFETNPIIDFCDTALGGRKKWIDKAIFLMNKFDKQLEDSRTGSKANNFFKTFCNNRCVPHLVMTPTLAKEDLPSQELFKQRQKLLTSADAVERDRFQEWLSRQETFGLEHDDEPLNPEIKQRIGFASAKKVMREIMLSDTANRLPEVLQSLRTELARCRKEKQILEEKQRFNDPAEVKSVVMELLFYVESRVKAYLDGDIEASIKFPEKLQTLEQEIDEEDQSDWACRELNHYTEAEDRWRDQIAQLKGLPKEVQANSRFLGGKQVQRAIEFFKVVMIDSLPDPYELKSLVANATGYLGGGLVRENWEKAMVQITKVCVKEVTHPGINYLIKHVGTILRRLFTLALADVKEGEEMSATFKLLPRPVENYLLSEFDQMLWKLLQRVAEKTHCSLEPMYSTVDPHLPTFGEACGEEDLAEPLYRKDSRGHYELAKPKQADTQNSRGKSSLMNGWTRLTGSVAKAFLRERSIYASVSTKSFLQDKRSSLITEMEIEKILNRSFQYIVALMEFNLVNLKFQLNHYLVMGFKEEMSLSFSKKLRNNGEWEQIIEPDPSVEERLSVLNEQIAGLWDSLQEVERIHRRF